MMFIHINREIAKLFSSSNVISGLHKCFEYSIGSLPFNLSVLQIRTLQKKENRSFVLMMKFILIYSLNEQIFRLISCFRFGLNEYIQTCTLHTFFERGFVTVFDEIKLN